MCGGHLPRKWDLSSRFPPLKAAFANIQFLFSYFSYMISLSKIFTTPTSYFSPFLQLHFCHFFLLKIANYKKIILAIFHFFSSKESAISAIRAIKYQVSSTYQGWQDSFQSSDYLEFETNTNWPTWAGSVDASASKKYFSQCFWAFAFVYFVRALKGCVCFIYFSSLHKNLTEKCGWSLVAFGFGLHFWLRKVENSIQA